MQDDLLSEDVNVEQYSETYDFESLGCEFEEPDQSITAAEITVVHNLKGNTFSQVTF